MFFCCARRAFWFSRLATSFMVPGSRRKAALPEVVKDKWKSCRQGCQFCVSKGITYDARLTMGIAHAFLTRVSHTYVKSGMDLFHFIEFAFLPALAI